VSSAVIIGAGVFGASLADRLARDGWEVTLVDRDEPGHPRAESGGETRLIRALHGPDEFYVRSARRALELWRELGGVLEECGVVWFARRDDGWEAAGEAILRAEGIPAERIEPGEAARLFPSLTTDDLAFVLHEPEAGVLRAADGVRALVARAEEAGASVMRGDARPAGAAAEVGGETLEADVVVWACGAWLGGLFPTW
jgi:glycine/D-amino acid oxidase-like deaminating enzyme